MTKTVIPPKRLVAITVNYDQDQAITKAIKRAHFNIASLLLEHKDIPLGSSGKNKLKVGELELNHEMPTRLVMIKMEQHGFKFADPLTILRYASRKSDQERLHPLVTFFEINGQRWGFILRAMKEERLVRWLTTRESTLSEVWPQDVRFLVVPK